MEKVVILTGAGISAESGVPTFRDANGLWHNHRVEDVATPEAFARNPALVHAFYNARRENLRNGIIRPNRAHQSLAVLEKIYAGEVFVITQNIDDLHQRAGTRNIIHMHGELLKARCVRCARVTRWEADLSVDIACPSCGTPGRMRPHVVWFGEIPLELGRIERQLLSADKFIAIGTSGQVYPAAGFVQLAREAGAETIEINLEPTDISMHFHRFIGGRAAEQVPRFVDHLLSRSL